MRSNYTNTILSDAGWLKANLLLLGHPSQVEEPVSQFQGSLLSLGALSLTAWRAPGGNHLAPLWTGESIFKISAGRLEGMGVRQLRAGTHFCGQKY